jgi:putative peptidoglycan lipid II flippase
MATPVKIGVVAVVLNLAMNVVFNLGYIVSSLGFTVPGPYADWLPSLAHVGPALATSLAAMFNVGWLAVMLARRGYLRPDAQLLRRGLGMLGAVAAMALALAATQHVLFATPLHGLARIGALAALVAVGLVVYGGAALALGAGDWRELGRMLGRRRRRRMEAGVPADTAPRP